MNKKTYLKPETKAIKFEQHSILTFSNEIEVYSETVSSVDEF